MIIKHNIDSLKAGKAVSDASFILTNSRGNYLYIGDKKKSSYQGFFFFDGSKMFKIIDNIDIIGSEDIRKVEHYFYSVKRKKKEATEEFIVPQNFDSLIYCLDNRKDIKITLDIRESYDSRNWGRVYSISKEKENIVVGFKKTTDKREDSSDGVLEYCLFLVIRSDEGSSEDINNWVKKNYELDKERGSYPSERYVFDALKLKGKKFVFSVSKDKNKGVKECNHVFNNIEKLKNKEKRGKEDLLDKKELCRIDNKDIKLAYILSINSLDGLVIKKNNINGLFAGLPWFFQFWSRDSAISAKSLEIKSRKKVLFDILNTIGDSGRVKNIYSSKDNNYNTADATGWTFFRLYELYSSNLLSKNEIILVKEKLIQALSLSEDRLTKEGFELNNPLETWMDTSYKDDKREGARIEIQALRLNMYKFAYLLTKDEIFRKKEEELRNNVKERFWNKKILADGMDDFTLRPNLFIAYYIYPKILTKKEWITCFNNALSSLWLSWGGISTIDKNNSLFFKDYTGEDNKSYHRGDSWFWINNLAALVLYRVDNNIFEGYINKILMASTKEILWSGAIGSHAEISSASRLSSKGCLLQAWSSALYIELVKEIYNI